jgi:amino acid transporter
VLGSAVFGAHGFGHVLAKLLVLMVLTSSAASTLTTILPTARTTLAMAARRAIPSQFARIHRRFLTPTWSTIGMGVASIAFYVILTAVSGNVLGDTVGSIGILIAFYYGMTGFACAWYFRRQLTNSVRDFLLKGLAPFTGGLILLLFFIKAIFVYIKPDYGKSSWTMPFAPHAHIGGVFLTGIGSLVLGLVLMVIWRLIAPSFFRDSSPTSGSAPSGGGGGTEAAPATLAG